MRVRRHVPSRSEDAASRDASSSTAVGVAFALAVAVVLAYLPVLQGGFVAWDDDLYVVGNRHVHGLSWENVQWAFTTVHSGNWIPLTWLSHAVDAQLYGLDPRGHHATALLLHVANTVLVFLVLRALTGARWRSAAVAALFGLHPLHVESVAWVSERKDVLSAFFWLLAVGAYARCARRPSGRRYALVAVAFAAAMLAKPMAVTLPVLLLLLDYWPLGRLSLRAVAEKVPLVVIALACSIAAFAAQQAEGGTRSLSQIAFADRLGNAAFAYVRYLSLMVWPARLSPWYSHPALEGPPLGDATVIGATLLLASITVGVAAAARRRPYLVVGWLWYLVTLLPVIGIVQVGGQGMADRYTYLPLLGIFIAVVWEVASWRWWNVPAARRAGTVAVLATLAIFAVLTVRQTRVWHDSLTLWTTTLARNPRAAIAYYALGGLYAADGRGDAAIAAYRRALKLRPDYANAHRELAPLLVRTGRLAAAAAHYRKAIAGGSDPAANHNDLANVLSSQGRVAEARRHLRLALRLRPDLVEAHNNLGILLAEEGRLREAEAEFRAALQAQPSFAPARQNLAALLAERGAAAGEDAR
jgi:Flp pilus assembly protein TadD